MNQKNLLNRRGFLSQVGAGLASLGILGVSVLSQAEERRRTQKPGADAAGKAGGDLDLPLAVPGVGMAATLKYVTSHKDVKEEALKAERTGVKWENQFCENCMLFTKVGQKGADTVGKCQVMAGQLVKSKAWCNSWTKKP